MRFQDPKTRKLSRLLAAGLEAKQMMQRSEALQLENGLGFMRFRVQG